MSTIMDSGLRINYALMKYAYGNLGDEIQSIVASRFLPHIDHYIYREYLDAFHDEKVKMILNGWFMRRLEGFPPSEEIEPLIISFHLCEPIRHEFIGQSRNKQYLIEHGPVGCRDTSTTKFLQENGVPAYFSGCLTMTLQENKQLKSSRTDDYILCVDVPSEIAAYAEEKAARPVYRITKGYAGYYDSRDRFSAAKAMLYLYHNASAVITQNLHTALPCLAFGTPVCLIDHEPYDSRFSGLDNFLIHCRRSEFLYGKFYDINNPPENPGTFIETRNSIAERCRSFTGFDAKIPVLGDSFGAGDIIDMLNMTKVNINEEMRRYVLVSSSGRELLGLSVKKAANKFFSLLFKKQ